MELAVLLSGEHPRLPRAELEALLAVHDPGAVMGGRLAPDGPGSDGSPDDVVVRVQGSRSALAALERAALVHAWGEHWSTFPDDEAGPEQARDAARAWAEQAAARGTRVAVVTERSGGKSPNSRTIVASLGQGAVEGGCLVDLHEPQERIFAWTWRGGVTVGRLVGTSDRSGFQARRPEGRAHFAPVGMHPRRAASLLHLARVTPGGSVYDPFCGTGGFVLEAAIEGYRAVGSDLDPWMVAGTYQTLTDAAAEPLDADVFVADIGEAPRLVGTVDGIVTDLPYGRASGTRKEDVGGLYRRAFAAFRDLLPDGGRAVAGMADPGLMVLPEGLVEEARFQEYVHKSLTRHYVIVKRKPSVERA